MARIESYPTVAPKTSDLLVISDVSGDGNPTKTATISSILNLSTGGGGGGGLSGSGAAGQITYWSDASSITGSDNLFYDAASNHIGIGTITPSSSLDILGGGFPQIQIEEASSGENPAISFSQTGISTWNIGLDNSQSIGTFKISNGSFNTTSDVLTITPDPISGISDIIFSSTALFNNSGYSSSTTIEPSSMFEARSTTKGFLTPRMTGTQRDNISNPAVGLIVFNTTQNDFNVYKGVALGWEAIGGGTYTPAVNAQTETPQAVGGIAKDTTAGSLTGLSFSAMFDRLLFPTIQPTSTDPSTAITTDITQPDGPGLAYVDTEQIITFSSTADRGTLDTFQADGTPETVDYAGIVPASGVTILQSEPADPTFQLQPNIASGSAPTIDDISTAALYTVQLGNNTWSISTYFNSGPVPKDSTGQDTTGQFTASAKANTVTVEGVWPVLLGNNAGTLDQRDLVSSSATNIICQQQYTETTTVKHQIAVPIGMLPNTGSDITIEFDSGNIAGWVQQYPGTTTPWVRTGPTNINVTLPDSTVSSVSYYKYEKSGTTVGPQKYRINWQ